MKKSIFISCLLVVQFFSWNTLFSQDLVVSDAQTISGTVTYENVTVQDGGVLTVDGVLNVNQDMVVESGGIVTHTLRFFDGLTLNVTGTLDIQSGGKIDVTAKGLRGGEGGGSVFGLRAETFDINGNIVPGAYLNAGGSYAGWGGVQNQNGAFTTPPYGLIENPILLGSGGGAHDDYYNNAPGGHGGGLIRINAENLIAEGDIIANGGDGGKYQTNYGGGGSGGSIKIEASSISGSGQILANGGKGYCPGYFCYVDAPANATTSSGGGGRIAVFFNDITFSPENIFARGGGPWAGKVEHRGGPGTIYLKKNPEEGKVIIENGGYVHNKMTPYSSQLSIIKSLTVSNSATVFMSTLNANAVTIEDSLVIQNNCTVEIDTAFSIAIPNNDGFDVRCYSGAKLKIDSSAELNADAILVAGGILESWADLNFPDGNDFELSGNGQVLINGPTHFNIGFFNAVNMQSGFFSLSGNSQLNIASNEITIGSGVTLQKDGTFGDNDEIQNVTIGSLGVITHSLRFLEGLTLNVTGTLEVQAGGKIDISAKGLRGGEGGGSVFGLRAETFDTEGNIVPGAYLIAGGSYGGWGGVHNQAGTFSTAPYGLIEDPAFLGSGGGAANDYYNIAPGGHGGGLVRINAGDLIVEGDIIANGGDGGEYQANYGAGGSGGSIKIEASSISGSGQILVNGGEGYCPGQFCNVDAPANQTMASGGGGRIAVFYDDLTIPAENILARGGGPWAGIVEHRGGPGTVYLKQNSEEGQVIIENGGYTHNIMTPYASLLSSIKSLNIANNASVFVSTLNANAFTIMDSLVIHNNCQIEIDSAFTLTIPNNDGFDVRCYSGAKLKIDSAAVLNANAILVAGGVLENWGDLSFPNGNDFELSGNGQVLINGTTQFNIGFFNDTNIQSGLFSLAANSQLNIASNEATIGSGVTLQKDGKFGTSDEIQNLTVDSLGIITHSLRLLDGLTLNVPGNLTVLDGGRIEVVAKGLRGGEGGGSIFGLQAESFDADGNIVPGANLIAGGSYGGRGGIHTNPGSLTNEPYGLIENPAFLGSGGGAEDDYYNLTPGGHGGGRITINSGNLTIEGLINANGGDGGTSSALYGAGGSGGSIKIQASTINGSGQILANGGKGYCPGQFCNVDAPANNTMSSGGGGRIAIYFNVLTIPVENIHASGGGPWSGKINRRGGAGTIYLKNNASHGEIIIDNEGYKIIYNTPLSTNVDLFNLKVKNGGIVEIYENIDFTGPAFLELTGSGGIYLTNGATLIVPTINPISGILSICQECNMDIQSKELILENNGVIVKDGKFGNDDSMNNITIEAGATITHSLRNLEGLKLIVNNNLEIQPGGKIDASAKGLPGGANGSLFGLRGEAFSPDTDEVIAGPELGQNFSAGASYGGLGATGLVNGDPNPIYGNKFFPVHLGSGGSSNSVGTNPAGHGGGRVFINTPNFTLNGDVLANGGIGANHAGGGSGGSITIFADTFSGNGTVHSNGGNGGCGANPSQCSGSGGGGRIAIYSNNPQVNIENVFADPGYNPANPAEEGTIVYLPCSYGDNVGVDTILYPLDGILIPLDTIVNPMVVVRNYSPEKRVFPVRFTMGDFYFDETYINLEPGQADTIVFYDWTVTQHGLVTAICEAVQEVSDCGNHTAKSATFAIDAAPGPVIVTRAPSTGGNTGNVTMDIRGANFKNGIQLWLEKPGGATLPAQFVELKSDKKLYATFNLVGVDTGYYHLSARNIDMQEALYENGIKVQNGTFGWEGLVREDCYAEDFTPGDLLDIQFEHFGVARRGRAFKVKIKFQNVGNIDIPVLTKRFITDQHGFVSQERIELPIIRWSYCGNYLCNSVCPPPIPTCYIAYHFSYGNINVFANSEDLNNGIQNYGGGGYSSGDYYTIYENGTLFPEINYPYFVVEIRSKTLEFREEGGPSNILRPGAGGEHTVWVYPSNKLYKDSPTIKFLLVD
jgi:hypothetical protein